MTEFLANGPRTATAHLLLGHGAGAPMTSQFLEAFAADLAAAGVHVIRFEFAYMAARRTDGVKRPPPRIEHLAQEFRAIVAEMPRRRSQRLFIGGKSMGGRVASLIANELYTSGAVAGLVVVGYPFHPPRKASALRTAHLLGMSCPALIVQGTRDPLGSAAEVASYQLAPAIDLEWLADGDHDLMPRQTSGFTQAAHIASAARAIARFMARP